MTNIFLRPWTIGVGGSTVNVPHVPFQYLLKSAQMKFAADGGNFCFGLMTIKDGEGVEILTSVCETFDGASLITHATFAPGMARGSGYRIEETGTGFIEAGPRAIQSQTLNYAQGSFPDDFWITPEMQLSFSTQEISGDLATITQVRLIVGLLLPDLPTPSRERVAAAPARRRKKKGR